MGDHVNVGGSVGQPAGAIERFRRDNDYEIICEAIDFQIARHRAVLYRSEGENPDTVRIRREAIANLNEVRKLIDPANPVTVEIARKLMRSYRADAPGHHAA